MPTKIFSIPIFLLAFCIANAQSKPFTCNGQFFAVFGGQIYEGNVTGKTGQMTTLPFNNEFDIDAIGYCAADNYIYGMADFYTYQSLCRIGQDGKATILVDSIFTQPLIFPSSGDYSPKTGDFVYIPFEIGNSNTSQYIFRIDLSDTTHKVSKIQIPQIDRPLIAGGDIAFEPNSGRCFQFGSLGKLNLVDTNTGQANSMNYISNKSNLDANIGALFFNQWGTLFGINQQGKLLKIDTLTGLVALHNSLNPNNLSSEWDACSCPYTVSLQETVHPEKTYGCTDVTYCFPVSCLTLKEQKNVSFTDTFPAGFLVKSVFKNPFGGQISGLGSNILRIENMNLPRGIDTIKVLVRTPPDLVGVFPNQAKLGGLDLKAGNDQRTEIVSDNPATVDENDPTPIQILELPAFENFDTLFLCKDSMFLLNPFPSVNGLEILWLGGQTDSVLKIDAPGKYQAIATTDCDTFMATFLVEPSDLAVQIPTVQKVQFGETINLKPEVSGKEPYQFLWLSSTGDTLCKGCPEINEQILTEKHLELHVFDSIGCASKSNIFLQPDFIFFAANVLRSGASFPNDLFFLQTKSPVQVEELLVFDRWGSIVFQKFNFFTNDPAAGWDGKVKMKTVNPGVFTWFAHIQFADGKSRLFSGNITILD